MGARKRIKADEMKQVRKKIAFAKLNNCPTSPRKMRLIADLIRGMDAAIELESEIKDALMHLSLTENHIDQARMTGSGSCVFVAFENENDALIAKDELPSKWLGFVAKAINQSPLYNWDVAKR